MTTQPRLICMIKQIWFSYGLLFRQRETQKMDLNIPSDDEMIHDFSFMVLFFGLAFLRSHGVSTISSHSLFMHLCILRWVDTSLSRRLISLCSDHVNLSLFKIFFSEIQTNPWILLNLF